MQSDQQTPFEPFLFTYSPNLQLKVENDGDIVPAVLQLEYLANTDGKLKQTCSE